MRVDFTRKRFLLLTTVGIILPVASLAYLSVKLQREMFSFLNYILQEYSRFSVDYAVSQVQELVRAREREVHMHYRLVAKLQEFDPGRELQRVEASYPMVDNAFLKRADGVVVFADESRADSDVVVLVLQQLYKRRDHSPWRLTRCEGAVRSEGSSSSSSGSAADDARASVLAAVSK